VFEGLRPTACSEQSSWARRLARSSEGGRNYWAGINWLKFAVPLDQTDIRQIIVGVRADRLVFLGGWGRLGWVLFAYLLTTFHQPCRSAKYFRWRTCHRCTGISITTAFLEKVLHKILRKTVVFFVCFVFFCFMGPRHRQWGGAASGRALYRGAVNFHWETTRRFRRPIQLPH